MVKSGGILDRGMETPMKAVRPPGWGGVCELWEGAGPPGPPKMGLGVELIKNSDGWGASVPN